MGKGDRSALYPGFLRGERMHSGSTETPVGTSGTPSWHSTKQSLDMNRV